MTTKYRAIKTELDGQVFDSKKEAFRHRELKMLERSGIITNLERQKEFDLTFNGVKLCKYRCDFSYLDKDGREVIEDVKGMRSGAAYSIFRLKAKLMIAVHGLRVLEI